MSEDSEDETLHVTGITTINNRTVTPENVEAEARRFAMRSGGILLMAMAENRLTERQLAAMLEVNPRQVRTLILGENYKAYLPLAALCLALGIKMDLRTTAN